MMSGFEAVEGCDVREDIVCRCGLKLGEADEEVLLCHCRRCQYDWQEATGASSVEGK